jgi:hypothetical protein
MCLNRTRVCSYDTFLSNQMVARWTVSKESTLFQDRAFAMPFIPRLSVAVS